MDASGSNEATGAHGTGGGGAAERAQEMRAALGARRDVESMLAEAGQLRSAAAVEADALVEEAQQISQALIAESRQQAERIAAVAAASALERQEQVRVRSQQLITEAEAAIRVLGAQLESTMTSLGEALVSLTDLREDTDTAGSASQRSLHSVEPDAAPAYASVPPPAVAAQAPAFAVPADVVAEVRASLGPGFLVIPESERPGLTDVPETNGPALAEVPDSVTAFARESASPSGPTTREVPAVSAAQEEADRDPAPEPVEDDTREATPSDEPAAKDPEAASRPLGWLFRSAQ